MKIKLTDFENVLIASFSMGLNAAMATATEQPFQANPFKPNTPQHGQWNKGFTSFTELEIELIKGADHEK